MYGVNINCKVQDFIEQILTGLKVIETRNRNTLKSLVGKRIGLIKTGCGKAVLVGYAGIADVVVYRSPEEFRADYSRHLVPPGSPYDIKDVKYGYVLTNVVRCTPKEVTSRGIVMRKV